jgi:muramoyltetrapeptide carboxypeptidase LdcA involved in peptidoglycan recycling
MKPPRLQPGSTIGVASPSWGGPGNFPHRVEQAARAVEALGFHLRLAPHASNNLSYVSDTPENRAADLHALFCDPEVGAIVTSIGGDHCNQVLPFLDFDLIRAHPKIFMGFSDTTVLNFAFYTAAGLNTFNGPAIMTDFGEYPRMFDYTVQHMLRVLCNSEPAGRVSPASEWTEEFLTWSGQTDRTRARHMLPSPGWTWLKPGRAEGRLLGGCIESLDHLRGTRFWPDWHSAIFFFETSEEKPSPARVDSLLSDYENMGVLASIRGMLVGRPMAYTDAEKQDLRDVVRERTRRYDFPVITDMDFGHTAPQMTLPIGCPARIDSFMQSFEIIEPAVQ